MMRANQISRGVKLSMQSRPLMSYPMSYAYKISKSMMPKISDTERAALNAGTVGFDREIFSGNPSLKDLEKYSVKLSAEEKAFMDTEVQNVCEIIDDYQISIDRGTHLNRINEILFSFHIPIYSKE